MTPKRPVFLRTRSTPPVRCDRPATRAFARDLRTFCLSGLVLIALSPILCPAAASAQDDESEMGSDAVIENAVERNWYFEFSTGASFVPKQTLRDGGTSMSRAEPEVGYFVGAALGHEILDNVRVELRIDFHDADMKEAGIVPPATSSDGEITLLSVVLNGYYDFDLKDLLNVDLPVTPFIGGGIGYGLLGLDVSRTTPNVFEVDDNDNVFVYNAIVGGRLALTDVSDLSLSYRYTGTTDADAIGARIGGVQQEIRAEYDAHELMLGLRFNF